MSSASLDNPAGPRAISRVLKLLEVLAANPEGLSLSDLSVRLGVPKSTLLNSLRPLETDAFLYTEGTLYRIGPRAFRLAAEISSSWSLPSLMRAYLRHLAHMADETALFSIIDERDRRFVHIDAIESRNRIRYTMSLGSGGPLYASASGRVLLAFQPQSYQDSYLAQVELVPFTEQTTVDESALRYTLKRVRDDGYCVSVGEVELEGAAIFAPVFGPRRTIVAAIGVALPVSRLSGREDLLIKAVRQIAAEASGEAAPPG